MQIQVDRPLDMHLHFREGTMLNCVAPLSARHFVGGVIMPNLVPPVDGLDRLLGYQNAVAAALDGAKFEPYFTLFFRPYAEAELAAARPHILGIKLYPQGVTTNSEGGIASLQEAQHTLALMQEMDIPLLVHGEDPTAFVMDREAEFLSNYRALAQAYPALRITMEHITTRAAVELLDEFENLFATVTLQHLLITLDDVAGGLLRPHLFCKPIAKRAEDRDALLAAALAPHPKLMFGSDSAPHPVDKKECCGCAAGCFTAPIALPRLAELFAEHKALDHLQSFVSDHACRIYRVDPPVRTVTLHDKPMPVPARYGDVVPLFAGEKIGWSVADT